ncbi:MAG: hypothetical protein KatS3mg123_3146 [Burkholderiales bacterium]|nr:MAG: hypothetical protein KatS3mg123_3146 [Burkholderiales bacterium]
MKWRLLVMLVLFAPGVASAYDYPTQDRVEYVLACMYDHRGKQEYLYKCSCAIDFIAKEMPYEEYVEASAAARYREMGGERMGVFRDPEFVKDMIKKYRDVQARAFKACGV